ncbi:hypothetical protein ACP4OV_023731 [Aristida adscensionis]
MESHAADEVVNEWDGAYRIYRSGKMERLHRSVRAPTGLDLATGVTSKDVVVDASTGLSARLFLPRHAKKLPVLLFYHGGGFLFESAVSTTYHRYVASLAAAAGVLAVSVEYRLAPEHPLPAPYDDHGDVARLFLAGDSAGGNAVHNVLMKLSSSLPNPAPRIEGAILLHPWFGGRTVLEGDDAATAKDMAMVWEFACPGAVGGADDPRFNPTAPGAPGLENLQCEWMLVCGGEKDVLGTWYRAYYAAVAASALLY